MTHIFDGKAFAKEKEVELKKKVEKLNTKGIFPKLVSIIVGDDPASHLYVNLKKKAGERVGIKVDIVAEKSGTATSRIVDLINSLNLIRDVNGIMVQLPLPFQYSKKDKEEIVDSICYEKDVDGLRDESMYIHPTSKAILEILDLALKQTKIKDPKIALIGATGMVGKPLAKELRRLNHDLLEADSQTGNLQQLCNLSDVIISATGVGDLIKKNWIKEGVILIDVGSPHGDIEKSAYEKASFVSPVPGGVGPVTISCLLENLITSLD